MRRCGHMNAQEAAQVVDLLTVIAYTGITMVIALIILFLKGARR